MASGVAATYYISLYLPASLLHGQLYLGKQGRRHLSFALFVSINFKRGTLMMENLTHAESRIGHNRLKLVGIKNFIDG